MTYNPFLTLLEFLTALTMTRVVGAVKAVTSVRGHHRSEVTDHVDHHETGPRTGEHPGADHRGRAARPRDRGHRGPDNPAHRHRRRIFRARRLPALRQQGRARTGAGRARPPP